MYLKLITILLFRVISYVRMKRLKSQCMCASRNNPIKKAASKQSGQGEGVSIGTDAFIAFSLQTKNNGYLNHPILE
jgi:hypothetical protein